MVVVESLPELIYFVMVVLATFRSSAASASEYNFTSKITLGIVI